MSCDCSANQWIMDFFVKQIVKPNRPGRQPQNQIANSKGKTCPVLRREMFTILLSKYFLENSLRLVGTYIGQRFVIGNYNVPFKVWKRSRTKHIRNNCRKRLNFFFKTVHLLCILDNFRISFHRGKLRFHWHYYMDLVTFIYLVKRKYPEFYSP